MITCPRQDRNCHRCMSAIPVLSRTKISFICSKGRHGGVHINRPYFPIQPRIHRPGGFREDARKLCSSLCRPCHRDRNSLQQPQTTKHRTPRPESAMASFLGNLMKGGGDATAVRKKKFSEGTLRYDLFKKAQETLNVRRRK